MTELKVETIIKIHSFDDLPDLGKSEVIKYRLYGWIDSKKRFPINRAEFEEMVEYCTVAYTFQFVSKSAKSSYPLATMDFIESSFI